MDIQGKSAANASPSSKSAETKQAASNPGGQAGSANATTRTEASNTSRAHDEAKGQTEGGLAEKGLKAGKSYLATVVQKVISTNQSEQQAQLQRVILSAEKTTFSVLTSIPLEEGELVSVKVADNFTLKLSAGAPLNPLPDAQKLAALIARILPYQSPLDGGLSSALLFGQQLVNKGTADTAEAALLNNLRQLLSQLPSSRQLSGSVLQFTQTLLNTPLTTPLSLELLSPTLPQAGQSAQTLESALKALPYILKQQPPPSVEAIRQAFTSLAAASPDTLLRLLTPSQVNLTTSTGLTQSAPGTELGSLAKAVVAPVSAIQNATNSPSGIAEGALLIAREASGGIPIPKLLATELSSQTLNILAAQKTIAGIFNVLQGVVVDTASKLAQNLNPLTTNNQSQNTVSDPKLAAIEGMKETAENTRSWLQTQVMKSLLNSSGVEFESRLKQLAQSREGAAFPGQDIKGTLIKLVNQLAPNYLKENGIISNPGKIPSEISPELLHTPFNYPRVTPQASAHTKVATEISAGELLKQIAGALNRIQFNQLNSLYQTQTATSDTMNAQTWMVDLPFLVASNKTEMVQVKIEQFKQRNQEHQGEEAELERQWKVTLGFDFTTPGPMQIQVRCLAGKLSSTLWSSDNETLKLLNNEVPHFRQQLSSLGMEVESIECRRGKISDKHQAISHNLVDIRT